MSGPGPVIELTDATFEKEVLGNPVPVVVDFSAEWCAPCKALGPMLQELAVELEGRVRFGKLDVDANPVTTSRYGIQGVPTLIFFRGGQPVGQQAGVPSKSGLRSAVEQAVGIA